MRLVVGQHLGGACVRPRLPGEGARVGEPAWSPSQLLRVSVLNGVPQEATQVYGNDGSELSGASVGISADKTLLIGSSLDGRLLDCIQ